MNKHKFSGSKENYYKNLKSLINKMNTQCEIEDNNCPDEPECVLNNGEKTNSNNICEFCKKKNSKYICPKCGINYCSVNCYKSHNLDCTEEFYKQNVFEELKSSKINDEESKKFGNKLKDLYEKLNITENKNNYELSDREDHLKNILRKIEENSIDLTKDLTPSDWKEFNKFLNNFNIENQNFNLPICKPFWRCKINDMQPSLDIYDANTFKDINEESILNIKSIEINQCIEFEDDNSELKFEDLFIDQVNDTIQIQVQINNQVEYVNREMIYKSLILKYKDIPMLTRLSKLLPSIKNFYTICNILCFFIFIYRLYNGEIIENKTEIISFFLDKCNVLYDKDTVFETLEFSLNSFLQVISKEGENRYYKYFEQMIITDLKDVLANKFYIFESLVRIYEILSGNITDTTELTRVNKNNIALAKHKIIYFMSYIKNLNQINLNGFNEEFYYLITRKNTERNLGNIIHNNINL